MVPLASPRGVFSSKKFAVRTKGTRAVGRTVARCRGGANVPPCSAVNGPAHRKGGWLDCANGKTHKNTSVVLCVPKSPQ